MGGSCQYGMLLMKASKTKAHTIMYLVHVSTEERGISSLNKMSRSRFCDTKHIFKPFYRVHNGIPVVITNTINARQDRSENIPLSHNNIAHFI